MGWRGWAGAVWRAPSNTKGHATATATYGRGKGRLIKTSPEVCARATLRCPCPHTASVQAACGPRTGRCADKAMMCARWPLRSPPAARVCVEDVPRCSGSAAVAAGVRVRSEGTGAASESRAFHTQDERGESLHLGDLGCTVYMSVTLMTTVEYGAIEKEIRFLRRGRLSAQFLYKVQK